MFVWMFCFTTSAIYAQQEVTDSIKQGKFDEITIVGSKSKSIPGSCKYLDIKQFSRLNQTNINNVLRLIPGVNIRDEEGFGLRPNIGLRGTSLNRSSKITLMEDGVLIAPAPYADPSAYYFPTFTRIHALEVLKGSSQIKYGPYTIGGAVNLLSTPIPDAFKGFAQLSYGHFYSNTQRIWIGDSKKHLDYVFEVNRMASGGFKNLENGSPTGFDRRDFMGKLRWRSDMGDKLPQEVTLKFLNSSEQSNETYLGLTYADYQKDPYQRYAGTQKDVLDMNHQHISLSHHILPINGFSIYTTIYVTNTFRDWARANTFGNRSINEILNNPDAHENAFLIMKGKIDGNIEYQSAARTYQSTGIQTNAAYIFQHKILSHKIQIGFRYHTDEADRYATRSLYLMTNGTMILNTAGVKGNQENQIRRAGNIASYINYELRYKNLKVSSGLRNETIQFDFLNYGNTDNARLGTSLRSATNTLTVWLPGIGVQYDINKEMNVFGGMHKGFSPPGMPSTVTSAQARAENSINYELGCRMDKEELQCQLTGFLNQYQNILGSDNVSGGGAGTGDFFNAGNAVIKGLEVSASYRPGYRKSVNENIYFPIMLAYTYTSAIFQETFINGGGDWGTGQIVKGDHIPFITPHLMTVSLGLERNRFNVFLTSRYTGLTRIKPGQDLTIIPKNDKGLAEINALDKFTMVDVSANYHLNQLFTLYTLVNNVTNNKAIVASLPQGYRPNIPISIQAGIKAKF